MARSVNYEKNLTIGPIFKQLILISLPLVFTNVMQLVFNVADIMVLGVLVNESAVGAVSSTTSLITLIINLFIGLSVGASVILSRCVGQGDKEKAERVVGTATVLSLMIGVALVVVGYFFSRTFLTWMNCAPSFLEQATKYLQIYFLGVPVIIFYNFAAGMLRAVGDTFRPMLFLLIAGVLNVGLNVFFITVCNMTVEGVAIGTVASQGVSAVLSLIVMFRAKGYCKLKLNRLKLHKKELIDIVQVGLPSGIQGVMFSISNVLIQTNINSFGEAAVTGNGVAAQFDGFVYTVGNAVSLAVLSFVSQNYGAQKTDRIKKVMLQAIMLATVMQIFLGVTVYLLSDVLCGIFTDDFQVLGFAKTRLMIMCLLYFLCGIMEVLTASLRGVGRSISAMVVSVFFACVFRIIWLNTVCVAWRTFEAVFLSYPVSQILCCLVNIIILRKVLKKKDRKKMIQKSPTV